MPPAGFKPTVPAYERPQTHDLDGAVTGFGDSCNYQQVTGSTLVILQVIKSLNGLRTERNLVLADAASYVLYFILLGSTNRFMNPSFHPSYR
jgi:hypothetical protein